jgi:putative hydrolase of the HAD superfamily
MRKVVSFDLDGTLTKLKFVDLVWHYGLPELYAKKYSIGFDRAKEIVMGEYNRVGNRNPVWYDLRYWFEKYDLPGKPEDLLNRYAHEVSMFPDAVEALEKLSGRYELIISSNAHRIFIEKQLEKIGRKRFLRVFSAISDFGLLKKDPAFFLGVCKEISISPQNLIHIGDDFCFDYEIPKSLGIQAYFLDRTSKVIEPHKGLIRSLRQLINLI